MLNVYQGNNNPKGPTIIVRPVILSQICIYKCIDVPTALDISALYATVESAVFLVKAMCGGLSPALTLTYLAFQNQRFLEGLKRLTPAETARVRNGQHHAGREVPSNLAGQ